MADGSSRFVFLDPHGRRWPFVRRLIVVLGMALLAAGVLFLMAIWIRPELRLPREVRELRGQLKSGPQPIPLPDAKAEDWQRYVAQSRAAQERLAKLRAALPATPRKQGEVRLGFYADWDANSVVSLHAHANELTHLAPEWLSMVGVESHLRAEPDSALSDFCGAHGLKIITLLRNLDGDTWQPEAVENLARSDAARQKKFAQELARQIVSLKAQGVLIDWNEIDPALQDGYTTLLTNIAEALHTANRELWLAVSPDEDLNTFDLAALSPVVDRFVALLSGEHGESDDPGPLASQTWFTGWLEVLATAGEPEQWVVALGAGAVDWNTTKKNAEEISFRDAMSRASYAGVDNTGGSMTGPPHYNGSYHYSDPDGEHLVWFLDAIAFENQLRAVRAHKFGGVGLERLGGEDPQVWRVLAREGGDDPAWLAELGKLGTDETVTHVGRGEIVSIDTTRDDGRRIVSVGEKGLLTARYEDFPTYPVLYHQGAADPHAVTITFDDGPDPVWTPRILDILRSRGVKAAFFMVGRNAEDHPDLVRRVIEEGHEIGNHTYSHGNLAEMPEWRMRLELDATERLIETLTGRSTTLFRPPYNADSTPSHLAELAPLRFAEKELDYTVVLEKIDPQDWARPGADVILQRVKEQRRQGNIILLHDAGGDRSQTAEALPRILDWLHERGDRVVSLSELLNIPRDDLMPPVATGQGSVRAIAGTGFRIWHWLVEALWAFMIAATVLVTLRSLLLAVLAWRHERKDRVRPLPDPAPPVSVLIAAYNEGKVIAQTLHSVLASEYPGVIEIIVVDDGSKDDTAKAAEGVGDARVRVLCQANAGKSAALSHAIGASSHDILVFLDADTQFEKQTVAVLVAELGDPKMAAVSGNAKVGNARNFVTHCQALEYICGFNLDRRAYAEWNCITVVPGAVSALRKSAIAEAGGFQHDTLAEDTDMTLKLHRLGYRIGYAPRAVAWTEAPESWRTLAKQRFRWAFGTMQCLWKHRDLVFNPKAGALGMFSLPSAWFFHLALVAITPLADAVLLFSIVAGYASALWTYFALFLLLDLLLAALACWLDGDRPLRALVIIPMRLVYRWLLAWVVWRSIRNALRGALVGWGKLERTANVPTRP